MGEAGGASSQHLLLHHEPFQLRALVTAIALRPRHADEARRTGAPAELDVPGDPARAVGIEMAQRTLRGEEGTNPLAHRFGLGREGNGFEADLRH